MTYSEKLQDPRYPSHEPGYRRSYWRLRYERDGDKIRAEKRAAYHKNKEAHSARSAKYYLANAERIKVRAKAWQDQHPEWRKKTKEEYRKTHSVQLAAKQLARYWARHEEHLEKNALQRAKHRDGNRAFSRQKSATLSDQYVREQLAKYSPLSMQDFPKEVVEVKRLLLLLKRITKSKRQQKLNS